MDVQAGALSATFCLTLNGLCVVAPDVVPEPGMTETEILRAVEHAEHVHTQLGTIMVISNPAGVSVQSNVYDSAQVVEVLSTVVARIARLVDVNRVHNADH